MIMPWVTTFGHFSADLRHEVAVGKNHHREGALRYHHRQGDPQQLGRRPATEISVE
jgi:hypothetical protein